MTCQYGGALSLVALCACAAPPLLRSTLVSSAGSCTDMYRRATGDLGNCSSYLETDVVYVSVNGDCEGRVRAVDAQGFLTGLYRDEILLAAAAVRRTSPQAMCFAL